MSSKRLFTNKLADEKSPYLLQHAHNPVDWFPWGEEAFTKARNEQKPIFLSIGYATCHWCHVMEKESFEDQEVAELLNATFVNIKLDREERPDIDQVYMDFAQAMMTSSAGWPLNVLLTSELYPFFATTYLPPRSTSNAPGLIELIQQIQSMWKGGEREQLLAQADQIVEILRKSRIDPGEEMPQSHYPSYAVAEFYQLFDTTYGGIKGPPKFPIGYQYGFLLHYSFLEKDSRPLFMVNRTLEMMQRGGIYDHLGGGFARYSVDEKWLVPHFEKMLYDNALLAECYCDAWKFTKHEPYRRICKEVIEYILKNLSGKSGEFYSAEDADSEGMEGRFYTWTRDEIDKVLGFDDAELFSQVFGVTPIGNFEGRNILYLPKSLNEFARDKQLDGLELEVKLQQLKEKMVDNREKRPRPLKDDKVLSSWNGLMIHSIVEAGRSFSINNYVDRGVKAAQFIYDHLWNQGKLYRRYRDGQSKYVAGLDEYAFMIRAALTLFEAGCGSVWLGWAMEMEKNLRNDFKMEGGAFYQTDGQDQYLIMRKCYFSDGAEPSGNAVHCENLLRLYLLTYNPLYKRQAEDILKAGKDYFDQYSPEYSFHYRNLLRYYQQKSPTIVISLNNNQDYRNEIRKLIFETYLPHRGVIWKENEDSRLLELIPSIKGQPCVDNKTTFYLCYDRVCEKPFTEFNDIKRSLEKLV